MINDTCINNNSINDYSKSDFSRLNLNYYANCSDNHNYGHGHIIGSAIRNSPEYMKPNKYRKIHRDESNVDKRSLP